MFGKLKPKTEAPAPTAAARVRVPAPEPDERHPAAAVLAEPRLKPSVLSDSVDFIGELRSLGALHVDGSFKGAVDAESVTIGATGAIEGTVHCGKLHIKGKFSGDVVCDDLVITEEAYVEGSLSFRSILVQRGARLVGDFLMREAT